MSNPEEALEQLRHRFAVRLGCTLDSSGFPGSRMDRARAFGAALQVDASVADNLLSGRLLPDFGQLMAICQMLEQRPGYFLDEQVGALPTGTTLVKPLVGGEDLVVRLPSDVARGLDLRGGLVYHRAREAMGFGLDAGDYLIALQPSARIDARVRELYLFQEPSGFCVRRCTELSSGRAVFRADGEQEVPLIVSTAASREARNFSALVGLLRCGASLHLRC